MVISEELQHDLLLAITFLLFLLFSTGKARPTEIDADMIILTS